MVAGLVPAVPGGTVHAKAAEIVDRMRQRNRITLRMRQEELSVEGHTHDKEQTWTGIDSLDNS